MRNTSYAQIKKAILWSIIIFLLLPARAFAQTPPATIEAQQTYAIPFIQTEQTLNMPQNAVSYWLFMPAGGEVSTCVLRLHFSFSNTLIDRLSALSVSVNGVPIATKGIYNLQNEGQGWWNVTIPAASLKANVTNEIKFECRQRSVEGECADIDNPNNWVVLHPDSYLEMGLKRYPQSLLSAFYPLYYEGLSGPSVLSTDFIIPRDYPANSLTSLLRLSSSIGNAYRYRTQLDYRVLAGAPSPEKSKNQVYIGPLSAWIGNQEVKLPAGDLEDEQGFLSIAGPSEGKEHYNTLITGNTDQGLEKAANFITNKILLQQADQDSLVLDSCVASDSGPVLSREKEMYKFSDFGYGDLNLAGVFHQRTNLSFVQPQGVQSGRGSYVNICFRHAQTLISDRSLLTVYINGTPVSSTKLSAANADEGTLKVVIPEEALTSPVIEVGIETYHYLGLIDCSKDYHDSAWTVIDADSELVLLPGDIMLQPSLKTFPYFYPRTDSDEPALVIGLGNAAGGDAEAAALLATRAGQNGGQSYNWQIWQPDAAPAAYKNMDLVFLGSYQELQLPEKIRQNLAVAPTGDGGLKIKEGIELIPETLSNKILFQVIRSPWNPVRRVYVILYGQEADRHLLKSVLSDSALLGSLDGQMALVDSQLNIQNQFIPETETVRVPKTFQDRVQAWEQLTRMPWWISLALVLLIIAALIALIRVRKVKNEFKQAGQTMKAEQGFGEQDIEDDDQNENDTEKKP